MDRTPYVLTVLASTLASFLPSQNSQVPVTVESETYGAPGSLYPSSPGEVLQISLDLEGQGAPKIVLRGGYQDFAGGFLVSASRGDFAISETGRILVGEEALTVIGIFDCNREISVPLDLEYPNLAGVEIYIQGMAITPEDYTNVLFSRGLRLTFTEGTEQKGLGLNYMGPYLTAALFIKQSEDGDGASYSVYSQFEFTSGGWSIERASMESGKEVVRVYIDILGPNPDTPVPEIVERKSVAMPLDYYGGQLIEIHVSERRRDTEYLVEPGYELAAVISVMLEDG